jgi:hypothetical protein
VEEKEERESAFREDAILVAGACERLTQQFRRWRRYALCGGNPRGSRAGRESAYKGLPQFIRALEDSANARQRSAHSLATGPAICEPFISPFGLTCMVDERR